MKKSEIKATVKRINLVYNPYFKSSRFALTVDADFPCWKEDDDDETIVSISNTIEFSKGGLTQMLNDMNGKFNRFITNHLMDRVEADEDGRHVHVNVLFDILLDTKITVSSLLIEPGDVYTTYSGVEVEAECHAVYNIITDVEISDDFKDAYKAMLAKF